VTAKWQTHGSTGKTDIKVNAVVAATLSGGTGDLDQTEIA